MAAPQYREYLSKQYTLKAPVEMASAFHDRLLEILPGQVEERRQRDALLPDDHESLLLSSAIPFVFDEYSMFSGLNDEEIQATDFKTFTLTIWWFHWDFQIEKGGKRIFMRDVVNTPKFLYLVGQEESRRNSCACTAHPLERHTKVGEDGTVMFDTAVLNVTFSKDGPCDECGKHSKNGRATCLCPFDQDDIRKMDVALRRQ
jgi:hypothetical protein